MSVVVTQAELSVRSELARIQPADQNPNFASMPLVQNTPILESGSNANGNWVKYEDGTLICSNPTFYTLVTVFTQWTYPKAFLDIPAVVATPQSSSQVAAILVSAINPTTCTLGTTLPPDTNLIADAIAIIAIGKWK